MLIASAALMTTLMLFWGLSLQGQSNSNFGTAIAGTNAQAAEQLSIDNVQFIQVGGSGSGACPSSSHCYTAVVYVRNFGDQPLKLAGLDINVLATGFIGLHCEVSTTHTSGASNQPVIVARSVLAITLLQSATAPVVPSTSNPGCTDSSLSSWAVANTGEFASSWNGQTVAIEASTGAGTQYTANFALPS